MVITKSGFKLKTLFVSLLSIVLLAALACESSNGSTSSQKLPSYSTNNSAATSGSSIGPSEASRHVGSRKTVCGPIVDSRYSTSSNGKPTFLNFEKA